MFNSYYNEEFFPMIHEIFPYIIKNNKFIWDIEYEKVTIGDFLITHNISEDEIILVENENDYAMGWGGDYNAIEFWNAIYPYIESSAVGFTVFEGVKTFVKWITGKYKRTPYPRTFFEAVYKRNMWSINELAELLDMDTYNTKALLKFMGYSWSSKVQLYSVTEKDKIEFMEKMRNLKLDMWV